MFEKTNLMVCRMVWEEKNLQAEKQERLSVIR